MNERIDTSVGLKLYKYWPSALIRGGLHFKAERHMNAMGLASYVNKTLKLDNLNI